MVVVHGTADQISPFAWGARIAELTRGELVRLEGTGHGPPGREPVVINLLLRELAERVVRLTKKEAHSEFPRSQQRHMISNVRITAVSDGVAEVSCNFVTYRAKRGVVDTYYGKHLYRIDCKVDPFRIKSKRFLKILNSFL